MSDFLATALGLVFTLIVCLLAVQALLSPWLRVRRAGASAQQPSKNSHPTTRSASTPETSTAQVG
jgi:hypothetical protein